MQLRPATHDDLPALKSMYDCVITEMRNAGMYFWDDEYPYMCFGPDIDDGRMYVFIDEHNGVLTGAFALSDENEGNPYVVWEKPQCKTNYINRFAVNVDYKRKGIGSLMLDLIMKMTKVSGGEYVRMFVVTTNQAAIEFYVKNGFHQVDGVFETNLDDGTLLQEYGFEKRCR